MSYQSIEVRSLTPSIGAEIHGVDLGGAISNRQIQEITRPCSNTWSSSSGTRR